MFLLDKALLPSCCSRFPAQWRCPHLWQSPRKADPQPHRCKNSLWFTFWMRNFLVVALFLPLPPRTNLNGCLGLWGTFWFVCWAGGCMDMQNCSVLLWNQCHFLSVLIMQNICVFLCPNDCRGKETTYPSKCCHSYY